MVDMFKPLDFRPEINTVKKQKRRLINNSERVEPSILVRRGGILGFKPGVKN